MRCMCVGWVERSDTIISRHDRRWDSLRSTHPTSLRTDLLGAQVQSRTPDCDKPLVGQITQNLSSPSRKIFCFRSHANHRHNSARLTADEGRWPSSRTCGEMRWTCELRLTCAAQAYGEVVWFGRRVLAAKSGRGKASLVAGGKRAVLRGEHEVSRKAIARGRPECSSCPVCSCAHLFAQIARETAGAASTRSSLRPLFGGQEVDANSGATRREIANHICEDG